MHRDTTERVFPRHDFHTDIDYSLVNKSILEELFLCLDVGVQISKCSCFSLTKARNLKFASFNNFLFCSRIHVGGIAYIQWRDAFENMRARHNDDKVGK